MPKRNRPVGKPHMSAEDKLVREQLDAGMMVFMRCAVCLSFRPRAAEDDRGMYADCPDCGTRMRPPSQQGDGQ